MQTSQYQCPNCDAQYQVVRVEAEPVTVERELTCLSCDAPLQGREGRLALKYFLLSPRRRRTSIPITGISRRVKRG